jgi:hypothetical protein
MRWVCGDDDPFPPTSPVSAPVHPLAALARRNRGR